MRRPGARRRAGKTDPMPGRGRAWRPASPGRGAALRGDFLRDGRLRAARLSGLYHEGEAEPIGFAFAFELADQRLGHAELAVGLEVRVLRVVHLRSDGLVARLVDEKVQMRGAEIVPFLRAEQRAVRPVDWNRIAGGLHAREAERAILERHEPAAQVHFGLRRVLVLIEADRRGVPYIHFRAGDGAPAFVPYEALEGEAGAGRGRAQERSAVGKPRRAGAVEGSEVISLRGMRVVDQADKIGNAERAGDQYGFVVARGGLLADGVEGGDRLLEFALGEPRLAHERVQMPDERGEELLRARVRRAVHLGEHRRGDVVFAADDHATFLRGRKKV